MSSEGNSVELSLQHEKFCQLYATERDFFGNGTKSYMEVYPDSSPLAARSSAADLLTNPNVLNRINEILEFNGLNDAAVDKELAFVIAQYADFGSKVAAIREYNKLKARITEKSQVISENLNVNVDGAEVPAGVVDDFVERLKQGSA